MAQNLYGFYPSGSECRTARSSDPTGPPISAIDCSSSSSVEPKLISQHKGPEGQRLPCKVTHRKELLSEHKSG